MNRIAVCEVNNTKKQNQDPETLVLNFSQAKRVSNKMPKPKNQEIPLHKYYKNPDCNFKSRRSVPRLGTEPAMPYPHSGYLNPYHT